MVATTQVTSTPIYRNRLADVADKYLFFAVFLIGSGMMILLKWQGYSQFIVTVLPVTAMLMYGLYVLLAPKYRLRSDRAGDSLYYLGFLFTMVSLAYSLYEFGGPQAATQDIITNFGIALSTTIVGLMLRVAYHQMREDPFDIERESRLDLAGAAGTLHGTLLQAVNDFSALRLATTQAVNEAVTDATGRMLDTLDHGTASWKENAVALSELVGNATKELSEQHKNTLLAARRITDALQRLSTRVDQVEIPSEIVKVRLELAAKQLEAGLLNMAERTAKDAQRMVEVEKLIESAAELANAAQTDLSLAGEETKAQRETISSGIRSLQSLIESAVKTASSNLSIATQNVNEHQLLLQELSTSSADTLRTVESHRKRLEAELKASDDAVMQVHSSLTSLTKTIVEQLDGKQH
jgi:hypothetical protein